MKVTRDMRKCRYNNRSSIYNQYIRVIESEFVYIEQEPVLSPITHLKTGMWLIMDQEQKMFWRFYGQATLFSQVRNLHYNFSQNLQSLGINRNKRVQDASLYVYLCLSLGDETLDGGELQAPTGHFTDSWKPAGWTSKDLKQIFMSPSILYAGKGAYSPPTK